MHKVTPSAQKRTPRHSLPPVLASVCLIAMLAVGGCTMMPDYLRPDAPVAEQFSIGSDTSGDASEIHWRDFFTDPQLESYIEIALENNRDLRVAVLTVEQARAQYRISRSDLFPSINAAGHYTRSRTPGDTSKGGTIDGSTGNQFNVSVGTTAWELDLFGRVRSLNRSALESYFAQTEIQRATQLSLVAQVATQYLILCEQEAQLALARQTLLAVEKSYGFNKKQFDVGSASELDLQTSGAQVETARLNVITFERTTAQAANFLALLIGQPLPPDLPAGRSLQSQRVLADIPAGLPSDLIAQRPDILAAEHTLLAANANIGAARAAFFPHISLTGFAGSSSVELSRLFSQPAHVWSFAPQISVPIFSGGSNLANLDVAKVSKRIEIANYEKTIQIAFREVADALAGRATFDRALTAQEALVAAQQRRFDLTNILYRNGTDAYLAVLLAQQDLYAAQSGLVTTRTDRLANLITLYKSLGGGWR
jgi:multidrug efflux system outer membrane protein